MKKIYLLVFLFVGVTCYQVAAQTYLKPTVIGWGDPAISNDDTLLLKGYNLPNNAILAEAINGFDFYENNDTIFNFHYDVNVDASDPFFPFYPYNSVFLYPNFPSYDTSDVISSVVLPKFNFNVVSFINPSSLYAQDGEMTIYFDSLVDITDLKVMTNCEYSQPNLSDYYSTGGGQVVKRIDVISSDGHTFTFKNLRLGPVIMEIIDGPLVTDFFKTVFYVGDHNLPLSRNCGVYGYLVHRLISSPTCASLLLIEPQQIFEPNPYVPYTVNYSITGPSAADFNYYTSNQSLYSDIICPGVYKIRMESDDIAGIGGFQDYDFVQVDPEQTYYDVSLSSGYQDSIGLYYKNCSFDYSSPITSIDLDYVIIGTDPAGVNIYTLDFSVFQNAVVSHYYDTLVVDDLENYKLVVGIYCDDFKGQNSFAHKGIAMVPNGFMSINENEVTSFSFSPNPAKNTVEFSEVLKGEIIDFSGRVCKMFNNSIVDVSNLPNGIYMIRVENYSSIQKLIIEH